MSDRILKSPLLSGFNFNYTPHSVIRFIGNTHQVIFDCHNVSKTTLIKMINYLINNSDTMFHVSYSTYKQNTPLFLTHDKPSSKPYWFNSGETSSLTRDTPFTAYITFGYVINEVVQEIERAAEEMQIFKTHLIMLGLLTEFSPNPWVNSDRPVETLLECSQHLVANTFTTEIEQNYKAASGIDSDVLIDHLKGMLKPEMYNNDQQNAFVVKARVGFSNYINNLKLHNQYNDFNYIVSAYGADKQLLRRDEVPPQFNLRSLDALFEQNLEYYKHAVYLEVYDPFDDDSFIYHPKIIHLWKGEFRTMFLSFPLPFLNWLNTLSSSPLRTRNSVLRQAIQNCVLNWREQWAAIPDADKDAVALAFNRVHACCQFDEDGTVPATSRQKKKPTVVKVAKPLGRPRIHPVKVKKLKAATNTGTGTKAKQPKTSNDAVGVDQ